MNVDAIIPIKGHSERVPNKNFRILNNKPLYKYIIETLLQVDDIKNIIIDTDVPDKIKIEHDKISIIKRPQYLRGDDVSVNKLISHDLQFANNDVIIQTHTTNPFLHPSSIVCALSEFRKHRHSMFSVDAIKQRFWTIDGKPVNHNPNHLKKTQDLTPLLADNSCFYIFTKKFFHNTGMRMNSTSTPMAIDKEESLDIDTEFDWRIAECIVKKQ